MINPTAEINVTGYKEPSYYAESRPVAGLSVFGGKKDVRIKRKQDMKPRHGLLLMMGVTAAILYIGYKLDGSDVLNRGDKDV